MRIFLLATPVVGSAVCVAGLLSIGWISRDTLSPSIAPLRDLGDLFIYSLVGKSKFSLFSCDVPGCDAQLHKTRHSLATHKRLKHNITETNIRKHNEFQNMIHKFGK